MKLINEKELEQYIEEIKDTVQIENRSSKDNILFNVEHFGQKFKYDIRLLFYGIVGKEGFSINVPASNVTPIYLQSFLTEVQKATEIAEKLNTFIVQE